MTPPLVPKCSMGKAPRSPMVYSFFILLFSLVALFILKRTNRAGGVTHESKIHEKASPDGIFNLVLINFCVSFLHYDHDEHLLQRGYL